jgi:hypothetical protein
MRLSEGYFHPGFRRKKITKNSDNKAGNELIVLSKTLFLAVLTIKHE